MENRRSLDISTLQKRGDLDGEMLERFRLNERTNLLGYGVAHDLSNIIEQIMIAISVLRNITPADEKQAQKLIAIIESSSTRAGDVLKKLMSESSVSPGERQKLHLDQIVRDVERVVGSTFPANIKLDVDISAKLWPISGSVIDIYQAITNVCLNARDAMPEGGELSLSLKNVTLEDRENSDHLRHRSAKSYVCLRIADTGFGIPQDDLVKIFQPFYSRKQNGKGTGMGLYNVRQTVEAHDGFITIESIPESGTMFYLYFPAIEAHQL